MARNPSIEQLDRHTICREADHRIAHWTSPRPYNQPAMAQHTSERSGSATTDSARLDGLQAAVERPLPAFEEFLESDSPDLAIRDRAAWIAALDRDLPAGGVGVDAVVDELARWVVPYGQRTPHPGFIAYIIGRATTATLAAGLAAQVRGHRGVGETTDIVSKETYSFADRDNRSITLRPEGTAGVVRAVIEAGFYGTRGGAALRNVNGSFYGFVAERFDGTWRSVLARPPDAWGGRAIVDWVDRLRADEGYDPSADRFIQVAEVLDRIYAR